MYSGRYVGHISAKCTRQTCLACGGMGDVLDEPLTPCASCAGRGHTPCSGCRADGVDCMYACLSLCTVCGALEGAQLPVCPGVQLTAEQHETNYAHYCNSTGPFAQATVETLLDAKNACYVYYEDLCRTMTLTLETYREHARGRKALFFAVSELWARKVWDETHA